MKALLRTWLCLTIALTISVSGPMVVLAQAERDGATEPVPPISSDRWIGVICLPATEVLRMHLSLPENTGLIVQSVVPGSPAGEAGVTENDILLSANDRPLGSVGDLVDVVAKAQDQPIRFKLLRKGDEVEMSITPAKRPMGLSQYVPGPRGWAGSGPAGRVPTEQIERLKRWIERLERGERPNGDLNWHYFGPAIPSIPLDPKWQGSLSVEITRQNDEPARIKVKRGNESWELTEDNLNELPPDIRPRVEAMLGRGSQIHKFSAPGGFGGGTTLFVPGHDNAGSPFMMPPDIQRQFDEMNQRMQQMLDEFRKWREEEKPAPETIDA